MIQGGFKLKFGKAKLLRTKNYELRTVTALVVTLASYWHSILHACEGCKMAGVSAIQEPQTVRAGFALSWSVLFLLFVFLLLFGILGWAIRSACQQGSSSQISGKI